MAKKSDEERLGILVEARVNQLEKDMKKAQATIAEGYGGMKRSSKSATAAMEADMLKGTARINQAVQATSAKLGGMGKAMIAGFAGSLVAGGIAGIVSQIGQIASAVASVGDEAMRAGLNVKAFQELKYVAEQNRVGIDALTDGIKELNLRADEFIVTGAGSAAEAFQRLGYTAEELGTKLQDPSALFTEIIGKLGDLDRAAQIRIADELFGGTGGEQFVQLINQGEEGIRSTIAEAHTLGLVMDEQMIAKAAEVDRKFNQIVNTVGAGVRGAVVEATFALVDFINAQETAIRNNRLLAMTDDAMAQYQQQMALLSEYLASAQRVAPAVEPQIRRIVTAFEDGSMTAKQAADELKALGAINLEAFPITAGLSGVISLIEQLVGRASQARAELASLTTDPIGPGPTREGVEALTFGGDPVAPPRPTVPGSGRVGGGGGGGASEAERQATAIQNLIAGLEMEREAIGLSAVEQEKLAALRQAGTLATEEQKTKITELIQAVSSERAAAELFATDGNPFEVLEQQMAGLESLLQRNAIGWEEYGQAAQRAHMLAASSTLGAAGQITGALAQVFEGNKAFAVANAVVNTAQGVTAALAPVPFTPMNWIQAAAVAASGAAQISTIMSTQRGSTTKPSVGGKGGSSGTTGQPAAAAEKSITLNLSLNGNGRYSREEVKDLFEAMTEGMRNGDGFDFRTVIVRGGGSAVHIGGY